MFDKKREADTNGDTEARSLRTNFFMPTLVYAEVSLSPSKDFGVATKTSLAELPLLRSPIPFHKAKGDGNTTEVVESQRLGKLRVSRTGIHRLTQTDLKIPPVFVVWSQANALSWRSLHQRPLEFTHV